MSNTITDGINNMRAPDLTDPNELAARWNKYHLKKDGTALHKMLAPIIHSAITSYGGGYSGLKVPAYKLAFDAVATFDPNKGADVKTHVYNNLKRLNRISSDRSNIVHIPEGMSRDYSLIGKAINNFVDEYGREPNDDELADLTKLSKKRINHILNRNTVISGSASVTDEGADKVYDKGISMDTYIDYLYASSDDIDKKIIELSSGKGGSKIVQNAEIARRVGLTPAAVSLRMNKLRDKMITLREVL